MAEHEESVRATYEAFHPNPELAKLLEEVDSEALVRTDAIAVVVESSEDGWEARWVIGERGGVTYVRALELEPIGQETPGAGVTARMLRELSPTAALSRLESIPAVETYDGKVVPDDFTPLLIKWARQDVGRQLATAPVKRATGRPPLDDELLAKVAIAYLEELPKGRGLLARVGARPEIDRPADTVRDWVKKARRSEFLTETKGGRKGGMAGPALIEFMKKGVGDD